jgi:glutamine amidotransferase-like uncharacterized protein
MVAALSSNYQLKIFTEQQCNETTFNTVDMVAFPGGFGDAMAYDKFFRRKAANAVADYVARGGRYLGVCMGAYWAGSHFFDILDGVDATQYIKRPGADVKRSYGTVAPVIWEGKPETMYFYDGCALVGDESKFETVARYHNGDPMAIIQNKIGLIGCHPESQQYWFDNPYPSVLRQHWHNGHHHHLLLKFVDRLMGK